MLASQFRSKDHLHWGSAEGQTVAELCADAHYYFAHSFNSPGETKLPVVSGETRTYTLSHQGRTKRKPMMTHFYGFEQLPLGQTTKSLKKQGDNNTISRMAIQSMQVARGLCKFVDGATTQARLQKRCPKERMIYLSVHQTTYKA